MSATTNDALARQPDRAQVRHQRRERIVGDLGAGGGDARDQRRLADVGEAEQPDVGEQLELEADVALLARRARLGLARRAIGRRREVDVAAPALAALGDDEPLAVRRADRRSARPSPRRTPAFRAARAARRPRRRGRTCPCWRPPRPAARVELAPVAEVEQRRQPLVDDQHDAARRRRRRRPTGPPLGTNFSRRNAIAPLPPSPAFTRIVDLVDEVHGSRVPSAPLDAAG